MFDLSGKRALVTGGGRGIGAGIAAALAKQGAGVAVNDIHPERANETARQIEANGQKAIAVTFDIRDREAVESGVSIASEQLGGHFDILVNNAGPPAEMGTVKFRDMEPESWQDFVDINLYGSLNCIRTVLDPMVEARWGRILQISSGAGRTGVPFGVSIYGAAKSGIEGFIRHLALEVADTGVTVNALALGLLSSALPPDSPSEVMTALASTIPVGRLGDSSDVAPAAVYLTSQEASWMTGQTINLNGGSTTN